MSGVLGVLGGAGSLFGLAGLHLQLDNIIFDKNQLEVPESLANLGGEQALATHRFPGGIITHQTFGAFPETIQFTAMFTGTLALLRAQQVDLIRASGREVVLIYGAKSFLGRVTNFHLLARTQWLLQYRVTFEPRIDLSLPNQSDSPSSPQTDVADQQAGMSDILNNSDPNSTVTTIAPTPDGGTVTTTYGPEFVDNGATTATSGNSLGAETSNILNNADANSQVTILSNNADGSATVQTFSPAFVMPNPGAIQAPGAIATPAVAFQGVVSDQLSQAGGIVDNIGVAGSKLITAASVVMGTAASALLAIPTPMIGYAASMLVAYSTNISNITRHPISAPYRTITVVNPNLPQLAAQYFNDANRWRDIAVFNRMPPDPSPIGSFTLNIPNPGITPIPPT